MSRACPPEPQAEPRRLARFDVPMLRGLRLQVVEPTARRVVAWRDAFDLAKEVVQ